MPIIQKQPPRQCEFCSVQAECRPYGPNGEWVCFHCGMLDEAAMQKAFRSMHQC